jgi:hypothetical protein
VHSFEADVQLASPTMVAGARSAAASGLVFID